jgi:hypothetical protein
MQYSVLFMSSALGLSTLISSQPTNPLPTNTRTCQDYTIPINTVSVEQIPNFSPFGDNFDVVDFIGRIAARDSSTNFVPFSGTRNVSNSYNISGTICSPTIATEQTKTILLATHGLGFDRR